MHQFSRPAWLLAVVAISRFSEVAYADELTAGPDPAAAAASASDSTVRTGTADAQINDLLKLVREAKSDFSPKTEGELQSAKSTLLSALNRLDAYLTSGGANGAAWKKYLMWAELGAQLRPNAVPDFPILEQVYRRYLSDQPGLERPVWRNVALALRRYIDLGVELGDPRPQESFDAELDRLASRLQAFGESSSAEDLEVAAVSLGWLERRRQALPLVRAIRGRLSRPNLFVQISDDLMAAGTGRQVDETEPVQDVILGTYIQGQGRTVGQARVLLTPDPNRALLETIFEATNYARTVGSNGPARIGSTSRTVLLGRQQMAIDEGGFHPLPAHASASASSHVYAVWSTKRGCVDRIVRKVAWKRIPQQQRQSEQIASRHAERRLTARLGAELDREAARSNAGYLERFRYPLLRVGLLPRQLKFSTTADHLQFAALQDGLDRLAAPGEPPAATGPADLKVRFHESLVNNYAQGMLAGQSLDRDRFERLAKRYLGRVPEQMQDDEQRGPWAITFATFNPMTMRIGDQSASITIRGRDFASDVRKFDTPMEITAHYRIENQNGAIRAVRQGELEIFPPGFKPNSGQRLPVRLASIRNLLKHRFDKILAPEIVSQGLVLPGQWQRVGRLNLIQLDADRGWMSLGWKPASNRSRLAERQAR